MEKDFGMGWEGCGGWLLFLVWIQQNITFITPFRSTFESMGVAIEG